MSTLEQQLEFLKMQQHELEERIKKEKENKEKLKKEASIEKLNAMVKPFTEYFDYKIPNGFHGTMQIYRSSRREELHKQYIQQTLQYNTRILQDPNFAINNPCPTLNKELAYEEIFSTLIGILQKQEKRIKELEQK